MRRKVNVAATPAPLKEPEALNGVYAPGELLG
jgi:hypothetical protein